MSAAMASACREPAPTLRISRHAARGRAGRRRVRAARRPAAPRPHLPSAAGPSGALAAAHRRARGRLDVLQSRGRLYFDSALAADGMVVVALDFRLAPTRYPAAVADVVAGIRWAKAHAHGLGARADGVGLVGGSSGGHLLMLAALCPSAPEFSTTPVAGAEGVDARIAYALPLWPILDPLARYRYLLARRSDPTPPRDPLFMPERLIESHEMFFGDEATMGRASALRIVEAGEAECLPPIWVAHPELDENVTLAMSELFAADTHDETAKRLSERAREAWVDVVNGLTFFELELKDLPDERHAVLVGSPALADCRHWIDGLRRLRPHTLSEPEERVINQKNLTGR